VGDVLRRANSRPWIAPEVPRRVVLVLLHASAILVVVIVTVAYQNFRSTGTVLDYGVLAYYLAKPGEAQGAVSSDAPMGAWLVLSATLLHPVVSSSWDYSLFVRHRLFAARLAVPEGRDGSGSFCQPPPVHSLSRQRRMVSGAKTATSTAHPTSNQAMCPAAPDIRPRTALTRCVIGL
jgi:hypothetical protein